MTDPDSPEIYRVGSKLIDMARSIFYTLAVIGVCCAVAASFVRPGLSEFLLSLGWFCIGCAATALLLFLLASRLIDHDAGDETPLPNESRPAS